MAAIAWRRCPFPVAFTILVSFAIIVPISPTLFHASLPWWSVLSLELAGLTGFAIWVETRRLRGVDCPWLDIGAARRLVMYGALWFIGLLLFAPLSVSGSDLLIPWIVLVIISTVSAVALLRIHITVDHGELDEVGVPWPLVVSSRLPFYLLTLIGAVALAVMSGLLIGTTRIFDQSLAGPGQRCERLSHVGWQRGSFRPLDGQSVQRGEDDERRAGDT